jgi:hypothetical protein
MSKKRRAFFLLVFNTKALVPSYYIAMWTIRAFSLLSLLAGPFAVENARAQSAGQSETAHEVEQLTFQGREILARLLAASKKADNDRASGRTSSTPIPRQDALKALVLFERADQLRPSARTVALRGSAEEWLQRWGAAEEHLSAALASSDDPFVAENRRSLEEGVSSVRRHMGELVLSGGPAGASVWVKDSYRSRGRGQLPLEESIWVEAGPISVQITAPGHQPFILPKDGEDFSVGVGQRKLINVEMPKVTVTEIAPLAGLSSTRAEGVQQAVERKWLGWGSLGVGAAALVGGSIYGALGSGGCGSMPGPAMCYVPRRNPWIGRGIAGVGAVLAVWGGFVIYRRSDVKIAASPFFLGGIW